MAGKLQQEIGKQRPFELPEQEAYLNLVRTFHRLASIEDRVMREFDFSPAQYNVLRILRGIGGEGASCSVIRDRMIARVPDITRLIDRLEQRGYVTRHRGTPDRRVVRVRITDKGLKLLERMDEPILDMHRTQLGHLSRPELKQLNQLLEKARAHPKRNAGCDV